MSSLDVNAPVVQHGADASGAAVAHARFVDGHRSHHPPATAPTEAVGSDTNAVPMADAVIVADEEQPPSNANVIQLGDLHGSASDLFNESTACETNGRKISCKWAFRGIMIALAVAILIVGIAIVVVMVSDDDAATDSNNNNGAVGCGDDGVCSGGGSVPTPSPTASPTIRSSTFPTVTVYPAPSPPTEHPTEHPTAHPTDHPTVGAGPPTAPTMAPTDYVYEQFNDLLQVLGPILMGPPTFNQLEDFFNPATIEYQTLAWMQNVDSQSRQILDSTSSLRTERLLDRYGLAFMYLSMNGPNWTNQLNFMSNTDVCNWYTTAPHRRIGVTCDVSIKVSSVYFEGNNMTGSIPPVFYHLDLIGVNFRDNPDIVGHLSPGISSMQRLQTFDITNSQVSGTIPSEIGLLSRLKHFSVFGTAIEGTLATEIGNCRQLTFLELYGNSMTGTIPTEVGNLFNLNTFNLGSNDMSGSLPSEIGRMNWLRVLQIKYSNISGAIPIQIGTLGQLNVLRLSGNAITGWLPSEIGFLTDLMTFTVHSAAIRGTIPIEIGNCRKLELLWLYNNPNLTGPIPSELGAVTSLQQLELSDTGLTGTIPLEISHLINLETAFLHNTYLTGNLDPIFCTPNEHGSSMDGLTDLRSDCERHGVTDEAPRTQCTCCTECSSTWPLLNGGNE